MILHHYRSEPITLDRARTYVQCEGPKPRGLWVSVAGEHDWPWWCRNAGFEVDTLDTCYIVTLAPEANVLTLTTEDEVRRLHDPGLSIPDQYRVDWTPITERYDGIIIAPYQWPCRMDMGCSWYYGWDCASGCIWNLDAIAGFEVHVTAGAAHS